MAADRVLIDAQSAAATSMQEALLEERFDCLLAQHGPALIRLSAAYTNTTSDRDDLFQEIAFAVWRALPHFRGDASERTYLFRIAHNRGLAYLARRRAAEPAIGEELRVQDPRPDPERELAGQQERQQLLKAVHKLPMRYRHVIVLTLEGLNYWQISEVLGISEANVGTRLNRARQLLRTILESKV